MLLSEIQKALVGRTIIAIREEPFSTYVFDFGDGLTMEICGRYDHQWEPGVGIDIILEKLACVSTSLPSSNKPKRS